MPLEAWVGIRVALKCHWQSSATWHSPHAAVSVADGLKLLIVLSRQPANSQDPSSRLARGRKLAAVESVQPEKTGGQEPSSKVAAEE